MIDQNDIRAAYQRVASHIRRTPLLDTQAGTFGLDHGVQLKLEFLQHAGSFKPRGAFNNLLSRDVPAAGVAAASGGNHGIAVAHAARALGHKARIFVPVISSPAKIAAIRARGADLDIGGERYADALAACERYIAQTGALSVHAFDAWETIAGQGTLGLEWEEQAGGALDTVLVATGGGGLIAGIAAWFAGRVKVVSVEPEGSQCLKAALDAGGPVDVGVESVAADSLGARNCGAKVYAVASRHVGEAVTVPDSAIVEAQKRAWADARLALEPGGATALAALVGGVYRPKPGERVGVLACGANVDLTTIAG
ncbi:threonine/serine dehydratase [Labrys portucalensis]|uniref:Threonine/serine dehydratase n=1 Tax=Labrys neptuniae TaxID=376174 RepID=A0ABV3PIA4_9HYPH|nr:threonine/serine dehydratase [Labrys neptuniae]MDT3376604.1 threonine/serine dehydratase [Labrys neptuniae]